MIGACVAGISANVKAFNINLAQLLHTDRALPQFRFSFEAERGKEIVDALGSARVCAWEDLGMRDEEFLAAGDCFASKSDV